MQYKVFSLVECTDNKTTYGMVLLNKKHNVKCFQKAIDIVKKDFVTVGFSDWTIQDVFSCDRFKNFDYKYIPAEENEFIRI